MILLSHKGEIAVCQHTNLSEPDANKKMTGSETFSLALKNPSV